MGKLLNLVIGIGHGKKDDESKEPPPSKGPKVKCTGCGDMVPKKDAVYQGKKVLCEECAEGE